MTRLARSLVVCSALTLVLATTPAIGRVDNNTSDKSATSSLSNSLSTEEMHYITQECEGFATEDHIASEKHSAYMATCISELSLAVKTAMDKLKPNGQSDTEDTSERK